MLDIYAAKEYDMFQFLNLKFYAPLEVRRGVWERIMRKIIFIFTALCLAVGAGGFAPRAAKAVDITGGDLIKGSQAAVYYYGSDGGRYCFPNEKIFFTWYANFYNVRTISDNQLAAIPLRGNVTYKPGLKMVKITSAPRVYAVERGAILRWVVSEEAATALYGADWRKDVDDINVSLFVNYKVGSNIIYAADFNRAAATNGAASINAELGLAGVTVVSAAVSVTPPVITAAVPSSPAITAPVTVIPSVPFTLSWSAQSGATRYTLQRFSSSSFANPVTVYSGPNTSVGDIIWSLQYYRIRAENDAGASVWSPAVSVGLTYR